MARNLIIEGLKDAVRHARSGNAPKDGRVLFVEHPLDVKAIRRELGLTQVQFADKFCFSLSTIRNWEQGRRHPVGAQKSLLKLIRAMPNEVEKVLQAA
jgi:putative transcriptional regulator